MTRSIISRLTDLFRSKSHAALDKIEDPGALARLKAQDFAKQVADFEETLANVIASEHTLEKRLEEAEQSVALWKQKAIVAVTHGRDDLAKECLARENSALLQAAALQQSMQQLRPQTEALKQELAVLRQRRLDAENQATILDSRARAAKAAEASTRLLYSRSSQRTVNFHELTAVIEEREAHATAVKEIAAPDIETDLALLATSSIDDQLIQIKQEIANGGA